MHPPSLQREGSAPAHSPQSPMGPSCTGVSAGPCAPRPTLMKQTHSPCIAVLVQWHVDKNTEHKTQNTEEAPPPQADRADIKNNAEPSTQVPNHSTPKLPLCTNRAERWRTRDERCETRDGGAWETRRGRTARSVACGSGGGGRAGRVPGTNVQEPRQASPRRSSACAERQERGRTREKTRGHSCAIKRTTRTTRWRGG